MTLADALDSGGFDPDRYMVDYFTVLFTVLFILAIGLFALIFWPIRRTDRVPPIERQLPLDAYSEPVTIPILEVGPGRHRVPRVHPVREKAERLEAVERGGAR